MPFLFFYLCGIMKKWYFRVVLSTLALIVVVQRQSVVPNQEIVLEFEDLQITSQEAQDAIENVKKQLQVLGAKNTRVSKGAKKGELRITYHSDADIAYVKGLLSKNHKKESDVVFFTSNEAVPNNPFQKRNKEYSLKVYEIQKSSDIEKDLNGISVVEIQQEKDGYTSSNAHNIASGINIQNADRLVKVAKNANSAIVIAIDNTSYKIPEVRAGPIS